MVKIYGWLVNSTLIFILLRFHCIFLHLNNHQAYQTAPTIRTCIRNEYFVFIVAYVRGQPTMYGHRVPKHTSLDFATQYLTRPEQNLLRRYTYHQWSPRLRQANHIMD